MRYMLVDIASKVFTTTSSGHRRNNLVQSTVDTRGSPRLMCGLVLSGRSTHLPKRLRGKDHRDLFLNGLQKLLEIVSGHKIGVAHETSGTF